MLPWMLPSVLKPSVLTPRVHSPPRPRWRTAGILLLCAACADGSPAGGNDLPPAFREPRPLPGCEGFEYGQCDIRSPECLDNLAQIASCVRGDVTLGPQPTVTILSEPEAEQRLLAALEATPPPSPNYFERALVLLGLSQPSAFEPTTTATRLAQTYAAYYRRDRAEVVVIDHGSTAGTAAPNSAELQALVLHELIHALQDRDHDLNAFARAYQQDSDGNLRGSCLIEGEARLHEQRLYASLLGEDVASVDWASSLQLRRDAAEDGVFLQADLYSSSLLSVPYAHGVEYVQRIWAEQGATGVQALFVAPPASMREILAPLWAAGSSAAGRRAAPALAPEGLTREAYSSLGAWGVYLLARPRISREVARQLALGWQGDLLEAFSFGAQQAALSWTIELATEADATLLAEVLAPQTRLRALPRGAQLRVLGASDELPPALLAAGQAPLADEAAP
ncbi:MAG: hypothetical protein RL685_1188 [Pseudomonadota bacterium]|jgi:hypothetical protein